MSLSGVFRTGDVAETEALGEAFASELKPGDSVALVGDLGAGKTAFVRGVARGLEAKGYVKSPSFTIVNIYEGGRLPLYHIDLYRVSGAPDLESVGLDEYIHGAGACLVEWADRAPELMSGCGATVRFTHLDGDNREIGIERGKESE